MVGASKKILPLLENERCFGCGCCVVACSQGALAMEIDEKGFLKPQGEGEKCNACGRCEQVCPVLNPPPVKGVQTEKPFAVWAKNSALRFSASSGGAALVLALSLSHEGYSVLGAVFSDDFRRVEHVVADSAEGIFATTGSKYAQSEFARAVREALNSRNRKYVIFATPCQIAGARSLITKKNLSSNYILIDFFCHGVPSYYLWWQFIEQISSQVGPILYLGLRSKFTGWHDFQVMAVGKKGLYRRIFLNEVFGRFYLSNYCLRETCYKCPYGQFSAADLRLGDYWGENFTGDILGTSIFIPLSPKGYDLIEKTRGLGLQSMPVSSISSSQDIQRKTIRKPADNELVLDKLARGISLKQVYREHLCRKYLFVGLRRLLYRGARKILPRDIISILRGVKNFLGGNNETSGL